MPASRCFRAGIFTDIERHDSVEVFNQLSRRIAEVGDRSNDDCSARTIKEDEFSHEESNSITLGEPPRKPKFIKTVWGVGYKID